MPVAVPIHHGDAATLHFDTKKNKPILCCNITEMTGHDSHHPKALCFFCQIFIYIDQKMPAANSVITNGEGKV